jgi:hypothetical protein
MSDSHREPDKPSEQAKKGLNRDLDFARVGRVVATNGLEPSLRSGADEDVQNVTASTRSSIRR